MKMVEKPLRVLIAKPGLDGHDRGAHLVSRVLRDSGMEVIYTGLHQTIPEIVNAASQEDVDVIGMSILSGAHLSLTRKLLAELQRMEMANVVILVGGTIPEEDIAQLKEIGVHGVFPVGTNLSSLPEKISHLVKLKRDYINE
jgi:methylmalonyl-CoA mutase, C-terminal domain